MIPPDLLEATLHLRQDLHRNIVSLREGQDLFDDLTGTRAGWTAAIQAELNTRPRRPVPTINRPFEEGYGVIQHPFALWTRTRYSDGTFGVWYGSPELETTVHETAHHFRTQLEGTAFAMPEPVIRERRVHLVAADALVFDLRGMCGRYPALVAPDDYAFTHEVGQVIRAGNHPGLFTRSARCDGQCAAIFDARFLSNVRDLCYLRYTFDPVNSTVSVERDPGDVWRVIQ